MGCIVIDQAAKQLSNKSVQAKKEKELYDQGDLGCATGVLFEQAAAVSPSQ